MEWNRFGPSGSPVSTSAILSRVWSSTCPRRNDPVRKARQTAFGTARIARPGSGTAPVEPAARQRPVAAIRHAMAYDVARGVTVLFGGFGGRISGYLSSQPGMERDRMDPAGHRRPLAAGQNMRWHTIRSHEIVLFGGAGRHCMSPTAKPGCWTAPAARPTSTATGLSVRTPTSRPSSRALADVLPHLPARPTSTGTGASGPTRHRVVLPRSSGGPC